MIDKHMTLKIFEGTDKSIVVFTDMHTMHVLSTGVHAPFRYKFVYYDNDVISYFQRLRFNGFVEREGDVEI